MLQIWSAKLRRLPTALVRATSTYKKTCTEHLFIQCEADPSLKFATATSKYTQGLASMVRFIAYNGEETDLHDKRSYHNADNSLVDILKLLVCLFNHELLFLATRGLPH